MRKVPLQGYEDAGAHSKEQVSCNKPRRKPISYADREEKERGCSSSDLDLVRSKKAKKTNNQLRGDETPQGSTNRKMKADNKA